MDASLSSCRIAFLHNSVSFHVIGSRPALKISVEIAFAPRALSEDRCRIVFFVSVAVGISSSRTSLSFCGSLLISSSLTAVGRLRKLLIRSVNLSKIASLSVKSVLPSLHYSHAPKLFRS